MQLMSHPGDGVHVSEALENHLRDKLGRLEKRFGERVTRIEAHFKSDNGGRGDSDTRCVLEAHPAGMDAVVVEADAEDAYVAAQAAAGKLEKAIDHRVGRLKDRHTSE